MKKTGTCTHNIQSIRRHHGREVRVAERVERNRSVLLVQPVQSTVCIWSDYTWDFTSGNVPALDPFESEFNTGKFARIDECGVVREPFR